jgi:hypothetical protein
VRNIIVLPVVNISASVSQACIGDSVSYSVDNASFDNIYYWYVNGIATDATGALYRNVLNNGDTVQCKAVYIGTECVEDSIVWSNKICVPRVNYPSLKRLSPSLAADTSVCKGLSVPLSFDVSAGAIIEWIPPAQGSNASVVVTPMETTTYRLRAWFNPLCVVSDTVRVIIMEGTRPVPSVTISSSAPAEICGGDSVVTYTVTSCVSCDSVVWYACGLPSGTGNSVTRTSGIGFDTVYVRVYRFSGAGCDVPLQAQSNNVIINRQTHPVVRISPRDTAIKEGSEIVLYATGAANFVWGPIIHFTNTITGSPVVAEPLRTTQIYVTGYNYPFCTGRDEINVTVIPKDIQVDSNMIYIPNAVVLSSSRDEDHTFTVKGIKVAGADIKIYNNRGSTVFSENGLTPNTPYIPVWKANEAYTGNYNYRITVELTDGEIKQFRGWISVIK